MAFIQTEEADNNRVLQPNVLEDQYNQVVAARPWDYVLKHRCHVQVYKYVLAYW